MLGCCPWPTLLEVSPLGVTSLADAGVASLADLAEGVTVGVASMNDAEVASLTVLIMLKPVIVTFARKSHF